MSGSFSYHHVKRTFRRNSVNPLPVAGYRLRLLRRCLDSQELSLLITACSFPTSLTVTGTPTESTSAGGDVLELLEFLQHDAVPYEVKAPPYSQNPGGSRRKPAKRIRAGNASRASPSGEAAGASKHDKNRKSQLSQAVQGAYRKGASGDATKHTNSSVANAATDATAATAAAAAAAIGSPVLNLAARNSPFLGSTRRTSPATGAPKPGPEQTSRAFEDPIAAPLQAVPQVTDPNRNGAVEFSIKGGNVLPGQDNQLPELQEAVWRLENTLQFVPADGDGSSTGTSSSSSIASMPSAQVPEDRREAAGATAAELAKPGLQLLATATAAATAATAGTSLASGDSVAPTGSPPGVSSRTGSSSRTSGSSRTDNIVQSTAVATAATAVAAAPPASTASTTESILAGRRAAVLWQWKQFLGPREGPHGRAAVTAQGPATATATAAAARAMTSESTTVPATTPLATATSLRQGLATATATATSVSSSQTSPLKSARPAVQVVVPGIAPPPPPDVPNAATGTAGYNSEAAEEASVPPPQVARVPAALLPLTLQGRISLMEAAAAAAAKEDAIASARRSSENVGTRNDLRGRGPRGIGAAPQGGRRDPPVAAVHLPVVADTPDVTAVKSGEQNSDRRTSPENPRGAATASPFKDVRKDQSTAPTAAAAAVAAAAAGLTPSALAPKFVVDDENGSNRGSRAQPAAVQEDTTAAAPLPSVKVSRVGRRDQRPAATLPPALVTADPAVGLSPEVSTARDLFANLVRYLPSSREDGPALLSPYVRYQYTKYQDAAVAATTHADLLLRPLGVQQLSYIAAAYAAAGHRYEPFLCMLTSVAADKMETQRPRHARSSLAAAAPSTPSSPAAPLTFRTACVMLTALARLRFHDSRLTAAIGRWLAAALRSGSVTPRARWKGTWLAAALWAYATLERISARDAASGPAAGDGHGFAGPAPAAATVAAEVSATGAVLFTEAVEAIRVDPGWIHLMDCREALWALWALKVAAAMYSPTEGTATEPATPPVLRSLAMKVSYTPQPLVELQLLERAASQLDQLDPGQLAEAYAVAAEAGFGADRDMLAALRRCTLARVAAVRPQPLAVMVASLAVLQVGGQAGRWVIGRSDDHV
ncbi:hypothetical protein Vafri_16968 [Volvox africanus]|uniref:Uncharacterized protein n=1 Tax=Volvox africanus TaxID=51714 RepID=A0A8J4F706_9CHLO|nr:hypothetical protein Vafri_16968 [Volvox africanus]